MKRKKVLNAIYALIICHNVTPVIDEDTRELQGSSPDELALVSLRNWLYSG